MHLAVARSIVERCIFSTPPHGRSITPSNRCTAAIMQLRTWGSPALDSLEIQRTIELLVKLYINL